jgi:hypothetical protein
MTILLITSLFLNTADALSCDYGITNFIPDDGLVDLPTNTSPVVWLSDYTLTNENIALFNTDSGDQEPLIITKIAGSVYSVLPSNGFVAETNYQFTSLQDQWDFSTFSIGEQLDEDSPAKPTINSLHRERGTDEWGDWDFLIVQIDEPQDAVYYQIDVSQNSDFIDSSIEIETVWNGQIGIGSGPCGGNYPMQEVQNINFVRISAYDIAGNQSEISDTLEWNKLDDTDSEKNRFGCHTSAMSKHSLLALFVTLSILTRRRLL